MTKNEILQYIYDISFPNLMALQGGFNDDTWRTTTRRMYEDHLSRFVGTEGLYDFRPVVDETNNTPEQIDNREAHVAIFLKLALAGGYTEVQTGWKDGAIYFNAWDANPLTLQRTLLEFTPNGPARP